MRRRFADTDVPTLARYRARLSKACLGWHPEPSVFLDEGTRCPWTFEAIRLRC